VKANGQFAQIDLRFEDHPKYIDYGAAEMGLVACGIIYANRNLTDGKIPKSWPKRRFGAEIQDVIDRLINDGVWKIRSDGNYEIVGFLDHNRSKAEIESIRETKAGAGKIGGQKSAQARAQAAAQAPAAADAQPSAQAPAQPAAEPRSDQIQIRSDPQSETQADQNPPPGGEGGISGATTGTRPLPRSERSLNGPLWIEHYQAAVTKATDGKRKWLFDKKQLSELEDVIAAHCDDRARIEPWIDRAVATFIAAVKSEKPGYWHSYQPRGLAKWFNEGGSLNGANGHTNGTTGKTGYMMHLGKMYDRATRKEVDPVTKEPIGG
jgi:hypothetical protein